MLAAGGVLFWSVMSHMPLSRHPYIASAGLRCDSNANLVGLHDDEDDVDGKVPTESEEQLAVTTNGVDEVDNGANSGAEEVCRSAPSSSPHFEVTRRMLRLFSTISAGVHHDDSSTNNVRTVCIEDLHFISSRLIGGDDVAKVFAARLLQLGLIELCQQICAWNFLDRARHGPLVTPLRSQSTPSYTSSSAKLNGGSDESLPRRGKLSRRRRYDSRTERLTMIELELAIGAVVNLTDLSSDACRLVIDVEFYKDLFAMLRDDSLNPEVCGNVFESWQQSLADGIMSALYNVVQAVPEARELFRDQEAVEILQKYRTQTSGDAVACMTLILLAYVINAEENDLLGYDGKTFEFLAEELQTAVRDPNHRSRNGYRAIELLEAINKLAVVDANKSRIVESGTLACYVELLNVTETESSSNLLTPTVEQQFAATQGLWTLASGCPDIVRSQDGCVDGLKKVLKTAVSEGVRRQVCGTLDAIGVVLEEKFDGTSNGEKIFQLITRPASFEDSRSSSSGEKTSGGHIFISYNHSSKLICLRLRDRLRTAGFVVWIDADQMCESIADDIISGLDRAHVVLVCMTQKYYESPYCKKEVIYSVESRKEIIPLVLEHHYKPHGWLKFHASDRLRYDFSRDETFEESFPKLVHALKKKFEPMLQKTDVKSIIEEQPGEAHTTFESVELISTFPPQQPNGHQSNSVAASEVTKGVARATPISVANWSKQQVTSWLEANRLHHLRHSAFNRFDGETLLEMWTVKFESPEIFAVYIKHELDSGRFDVIDVLRLNKALRQLQV